MSDEYEKRDYDEIATSQDSALGQDLTQSRYLSTSPCTNGDCTTKVGTEPEKAWIELMSAIPVRDQKVSARSASMAMPNNMTVQEVMEDIRPDNANEHSIQTIKEGWDDFRNKFSYYEGILSTALTNLSQEWTGDDYDAFEEQVNIVIDNLKQVMEDVGEIGKSGALGLLSQKQEEIYALQGSGGEAPYPAPQLWWDSGGVWGVKEIHIRPAFWDKGECEKQEDPFGDGCGEPDAGGKKFMEMAGFDTDRPDEVHNFIEDRTRYYMEKHKDEGITETEARELAKGDASETVQQDSEEAASNYEERASIVNQDVISRRDTTSTAVSEITPESVPATDSTLKDPNAPTSDLPPMEPGGGGGMPSPGGMGSMDPPGASSPLGSGDLGGGLDSGGLGNGGLDGGGGGGGLGDYDSGGLDDNPWSSGVTDPDDVSGGLAGGGGGLGGGLGGGAGGGGLGGGAGGGLGGGVGGGAGGGMPGGMVAGGGGMGRGAGGGAGAGKGGMKGGGMGAGAGKGAGGGRVGGMGGMMGGAGRGMGGAGENEDGKDTWLVEEDDVWGIGNAEEDPYA